MKYATLRETKKEGEKEINFFIAMNRKYKRIMKEGN